jgi:hypothetical protein
MADIEIELGDAPKSREEAMSPLLERGPLFGMDEMPLGGMLAFTKRLGFVDPATSLSDSLKSVLGQLPDGDAIRPRSVLDQMAAMDSSLRTAPVASRQDSLASIARQTQELMKSLGPSQEELARRNYRRNVEATAEGTSQALEEVNDALLATTGLLTRVCEELQRTRADLLTAEERVHQEIRTQTAVLAEIERVLSWLRNTVPGRLVGGVALLLGVMSAIATIVGTWITVVGVFR